MCLTSAITKKNCPKGRAGINKIWVADCTAILDILFDNATREVVGVVMDATHPNPVFVCIEFEKNTAFFNQTKSKIKNSTNIEQIISFVEPIQNPLVRNQLEDLNDCCCMVAIVRDNSGYYHFTGVSYFYETDTWQYEDMITDAGSANTGADPTADSNEYVETLKSNTGFYAPFWTAGEAAIPQ